MNGDAASLTSTDPPPVPSSLSYDSVMAGLEYGKSVTDGCISLATTEEVLQQLADAVQARRRAVA